MSLDQLHSLPPEEQMAILDGPALEPPPGVMPDLDHPPNDNAVALAAVTICLIFATISFILRFYSRIFVLRKLLPEDCIAFIGYVFTVSFAGFGYRLYHGVGFFVNQWNVRVRDLSEVLYVTHVASNLYSVAIMMLKIAILLEWARMFAPPGTNRTFRKLCHLLILTTALFYSASFIAENLSCMPHDAIWNKTIPAKCFNHKALDVVSATINIVSHLFILALPQLVIWRLNMRKDRKIGVSLMFTVGILTVVAGGFRLGTTVQYFLSPDTTYHISPVALWSQAELTLLTLVFCLPSFPSVFRDPKLIGVLSPLFRSWASIFSPGSSKSSKAGGASDNRTASTNSYQKIDDTATPLRNLGSHRCGERSVSAFRGHPDSHSTPTATENGNNILVTTYFEQNEEVRRSGL
ncbi:hypothetical protein F4861DRAFT_494697 [Xylaria intraflava]|nr:hypothetical protein F4861DRAFT_494697 [Xylaria intraflava]